MGGQFPEGALRVTLTTLLGAASIPPKVQRYQELLSTLEEIKFLH